MIPEFTPSSALTPALAAALTAGAGFVPMYGFWVSGTHPEGVLGLFDYWSATLGDAIVLPALSASLVAANRKLLPVSGNLPATVGLVAGAAIGAASQLIWLLDSAPQLNWTIPEPHQFTIAGWWHAGFVVSYAGFIGSHVGAIAASLARRRPLSTTALLCAGAAIVLFAGLVVIDNRSTLDTVATRASLIGMAVGAAAMGGVALIARFRARRRR